MKDLLQVRGNFTVGGFHLFAGHQLEPNEVMVVGHAHHYPHLMVMLNPPQHECPHCKGALPVPNYEITVTGDKGEEHVRQLGPYGLAYIRAGYEHSIKQTTPGVLGGFTCVFPAYDENGKIQEVLRDAEPGVAYENG